MNKRHQSLRWYDRHVEDELQVTEVEIGVEAVSVKAAGDLDVIAAKALELWRESRKTLSGSPADTGTVGFQMERIDQGTYYPVAEGILQNGTPGSVGVVEVST